MGKGLFNVPAYVYVYVDKRTEEPVYVGKVNSGSSLDSRINDHKQDFWYDSKTQIIYYTPVESSATADILETALINEFLKDGYKLANIAKTTWGTTSYISKDRFGWIQYEECNSRIVEENRRKLEAIETLISLKERELHKLQFVKEESDRRDEYNVVL